MHAQALVMYTVVYSAPYKEKPRWPMQRGGAAFITLRVTAADGSDVEYISNDIPLEKRCTLHFRALTGVRRPYSSYMASCEYWARSYNGKLLTRKF